MHWEDAPQLNVCSVGCSRTTEGLQETAAPWKLEALGVRRSLMESQSPAGGEDNGLSRARWTEPPGPQIHCDLLDLQRSWGLSGRSPHISRTFLPAPPSLSSVTVASSAGLIVRELFLAGPCVNRTQLQVLGEESQEGTGPSLKAGVCGFVWESAFLRPHCHPPPGHGAGLRAGASPRQRSGRACLAFPVGAWRASGTVACAQHSALVFT